MKATLYTTINFSEGDSIDQGPFTGPIEYVTHLIKSTIEAFKDATSFEFILVPKEEASG